MRPLALALLLLSTSAACQQERASPVVPPPAALAPAAAAAKVAKVVFIDQQEACECTRKRIDGTWTALQASLAAARAVPVARIHRDTEAAKAEAYTAVRPMMVAPALYFVDANDAVLELLQGELTAEQIAAALER